MKCSHIDQALERGGKIHSFRSGGGLRVFRLEIDGKLKGYGEHPDALVAIQHLEEDLAAGGRPYGEVYGVIHTHYLTGVSAPSCELDRWLLRGLNVDATHDGEGVVVEAIDAYTPTRTTRKANTFHEALNAIFPIPAGFDIYGTPLE